MDDQLYKSLRIYTLLNYRESFQKVGEEQLIAELPMSLREDVQFHQYGTLIQNFPFFTELKNNQFVWEVAKTLTKCQFEARETVFVDETYSDCMYLIYKGSVRLYASNDLPFAHFRVNYSLGDSEMLLNFRRNGTAITNIQCLFYRITRINIMESLANFPEIKEAMISHAHKKNRDLAKAHQKILKKSYIYDTKTKISTMK